MTRIPYTRSDTRPRAAVVAAAAAVAALLGACGAPPSAPGAAPATSAGASPSPTSVGPRLPAKPVLLDLAGRLTDTPADQTSGGYLHTTRVNIYRDITYPQTNGAESPLVVMAHQLWRSPAGDKGRELSARYDNGRCTPGDDSTWNDKRYQERFRPRVTADINRLRSLLSSGAGRTPAKPVDVLAGIAAAYEDDVIEKPVRAAMLQILADQPGLYARTAATDELGRTGILLGLPYVDAQGVKADYHLLLDPRTGTLLSTHETITPPLPATFDPLLGADAAMSVIASHDGTRLYLHNRYTPDTTATPVGCASPDTDTVSDLSRMLAASPPPWGVLAAGGRA